MDSQRKELIYRKSEPLNGIIRHLTRECGGNVYDKGVVNIMGIGWDIKNILAMTGSCYCTYETENAWICYDFNDRRVIPTSYTLRSCADRPGGKHLKSWIIEVSNDGYLWEEIDRQDNNNDLNDSFVTANFEVSSVPSKSFRFFRLRQIGPNHNGKRELWLTAMEIFGSMFMIEKIEQPHPQKREFVCQTAREGSFPPPLFHPKLDGIIAYLTLEYGGNVHDKGIVNITASSILSSERNTDHYPKHAADLGTYYHYMSKNEENSWLCYDFKAMRVIPTSYSLKSCGGGCGWLHLKSWIIEVSNDGESWIIIDRQDNHDLNGPFLIVNFRLARIPSEGFRFFRLRQTGRNHWFWRDIFCFSVPALEIFGTLCQK